MDLVHEGCAGIDIGKTGMRITCFGRNGGNWVLLEARVFVRQQVPDTCVNLLAVIAPSHDLERRRADRRVGFGQGLEIAVDLVAVVAPPHQIEATELRRLRHCEYHSNPVVRRVRPPSIIGV
ncbi:hypothetical protein [Streptomyces canus]|uniref:hypothetical protein n=1 Tax=Streptomyces canus TaxID=58343 RepID=UPI0032522CF7